jgi:hypothetical protein
MASSMMMDRSTVGMPGMNVSSVPGVGTPAGVSPSTNWLMVPRCTLKVEKCKDGMKITCSCDDKTSCSMVQNLCTMLAGGMCSCCCMMNGVTVFCCNLMMGMCKCEMTKDGVCLTCTSGDAKCCEMIQSCCDTLCCMMKSGCTCCVLVHNTPVCCGCC